MAMLQAAKICAAGPGYLTRQWWPVRPQRHSAVQLSSHQHHWGPHWSAGLYALSNGMLLSVNAQCHVLIGACWTGGNSTWGSLLLTFAASFSNFEQV